MEGNDFDRFQQALETACKEVRGDHLVDDLTPVQMKAHISIKDMRKEELANLFTHACRNHRLLIPIQEQIDELEKKGIDNTDEQKQKLYKTRLLIFVGTYWDLIRESILSLAKLEHEEGIHVSLDKKASITEIVAHLGKKTQL